MQEGYREEALFKMSDCTVCVVTHRREVGYEPLKSDYRSSGRTESWQQGKRKHK